MARKKSKAKQREEFINTLFASVGFISFFGTYYFTHSFSISVSVMVITFVIVISVMIFNRLKRMERLKRSGIKDIDEMEGFQFERYLGHLFKDQGYNVKVTKPIGDYGADLIISKDGKRIVVQAKRYSKNVGIKAVQEAQASIAHYKASEAWVVTNSDYTEAAKTLAKSNQVKLINRDKLVEMILQRNEPISPAPISQPVSSMVMAEQVSANVLPCTRCGGKLVLRKGSSGDFFGCSSFPKCRYSAPV